MVNEVPKRKPKAMLVEAAGDWLAEPDAEWRRGVLYMRSKGSRPLSYALATPVGEGGWVRMLDKPELQPGIQQQLQQSKASYSIDTAPDPETGEAQTRIYVSRKSFATIELLRGYERAERDAEQEAKFRD